MHLSKAFDTLPHGLIVLKLKQCQVDDKIINLIKDYLFNRRQRVKLGNVILHGRIQRREFPSIHTWPCSIQHIYERSCLRDKT